MKGKKWVKFSSTILAGMLTLSSLSLDVFAATIRTTSQTQMQSDAETVYVNNYSAGKRQANFNSNWKFNLGDVKGAESKIFDDAKWDIVSVPHDYSILQNYQPNLEAESGYLPGGTGWYRKYFMLSNDMVGKRLRIDFEGVYNNATVYVNGTEVGMHPYGYTPFSFDITDYVKLNEENVIAVKVDHQTPSSRWYSGSGIYRDVNLTVLDNVHIALHGQSIDTPNLATEQADKVTMNLNTTVNNVSNEAVNVELKHTVYEKNDEKAVLAEFTSNASEVKANSSIQIATTFKTNKAPKLWDIKTPNLYVVKTEVMMNDVVVDTIQEDYGFRWFTLDVNRGAFLNGQTIKLKGICLHHDQGSLGAAAYYDAIYRQVKIMKEMGVNSIRVTHNPSSQVLIDICNQEGILLVEEIFDGWMYYKNKNFNDFSVWFNQTIEESNNIMGKGQNMTWAEFEVKNTVSRGQNDPSIIMYSLGNEIQEGTDGGENYDRKCEELIRWAKEADAECLLTIGSNAVKGEGAEHVNIANQLTAIGGASGTNYSDGTSYDHLHGKYPTWNLYGSETASSINSRGVYTSTEGGLDANKQLTSYDNSYVSWGASANQAWYDVIKRDFVFGEYVWTGFDYIGEPTPKNGVTGGPQGSWPSPKNSYFGIVDTAGFAKDSYYFYQSQWNDLVHTLHILPVWDRDSIVIKNGKVEVVVYSDADRVELWLNDGTNDVKVGSQDFETKTTTNGHTYKHKVGKDNNGTDLFSTFSVDYKEGTLYAKAFKKVGDTYQQINDTVGRSSVSTTATPTKLTAVQSRTEMQANNSDLVYIKVDVQDDKGNTIPDAANKVTFKVEGEGTLVGVDNGSSPDHQSYQDDNRKAHAGKVLAIVKATNKPGNIKVTALANGLSEAVVNVTTTPVSSEQATNKVPLTYRMARNLYVKLGNQPELPKDVEMSYSDGTKERLNIKWNTPSDELINQVGSFQITGVATPKTGVTENEIIVTANVNIISNIAALLNYSTTVEVGTKELALPAKRPVILEDGQVLSTMFDVTWDQIPEGAFDKVSDTPVLIKGKANIFGETKEVTASIRVQEAKISLGANLAGMAHLSQDIKSELQSDTLQAIVDGTPDYVPGSDPNTTGWSNYKNTQAGDRDATLTFRYDTQQYIGEIEVSFFRDNWSARYPKSGAIKFLVDDKPLEILEEKIPADKPDVGYATYVYKITPVLVTELKMLITNSDEAALQPNIKSCTGISEVVIKGANKNFITNTSAGLASLTLNGKAASASELSKGSIQTSAIVANLTNVVGKDNASVTIIPAYKDVVKIITESEDHKTRKIFDIQLNTTDFIPVGPTDTSQDIPRDQIQEVIAGNQHDDSNKKEHVKDNNPDTIWHTSWREDVPKEDLWVGYNFKEVKHVTGLRYLPRQSSDSNNGLITSFKVQYKARDDDSWHDAQLLDENGKELAEGKWANNKDWKSVNIKEVKAKQIRILSLHSVGDNNHEIDKYASCAELRVSAVAPKVDLSKFTVEVEGVTNGVLEVVEPTNPKVIVKNGNQILVYGVDYKVTYKHTDSFNKNAQVNVEGIGAYEGQVSITFEMKQAPQVVTSIAYVDGSTKQQYVVGETFNPIGMKIRLIHNYGKDTEVAYTKDNANEFTFNPGLDVALQETHQQVIVTYNGMDTVIDLTISKPTINKADLESMIHQAENIDLTHMSSESVQAFKEALSDAKNVLNDETVTQKTVDDAKAKLEDAINHLKPMVVDKTKLENLLQHIAKTNLDYSKFTDQSVARFKEKLMNAKDVLENINATQQEVNRAHDELESTWLLLELKDIPTNVDKSKLESLIREATLINLEKYTQESIQALQDAIQLASELVENEKASQEQIDAMMNVLQNAINGLEKRSNSSTPTTGDATKIGVSVVALGLAAAGIYVSMRKKKAIK